MNPKFAVIVSMLGQYKDRFTVYGVERTLAERFALASQVKDLTGVEMVYPFEFENMEEVNKLLIANKLKCSAVNVNLKADAKFHRGSFTSPYPEIRTEAIHYLKEAMNIAAVLGCFMVTVCPLADGHDYPFEVDYRQAWRWLREGIAEAGHYRSDVKISLEYKPSETRTHDIMNSAGIALHLCNQIGLPNLGVTLDIGHALFNGETPAQIVSLLAETERLFLVHLNDNYRDFDSDMIPGTVNLWDLMETLLYLDEVGYEGWLVSDVSPARLDPVRVTNMTFTFVQTTLLLLEKIKATELRRLIGEHDVLNTMTHILKSLREG
ncbi:MAG: hypothetical protein A2Z16_16220 [Chloroflexi bacterium RBG_16_54_18]|nr:MAG: hypothetical protein A2Z16_16220 [Chloroflexi bacterium RBG_16_54_18]